MPEFFEEILLGLSQEEAGELLGWVRETNPTTVTDAINHFLIEAVQP
jgi:hypothetical protein